MVSESGLSQAAKAFRAHLKSNSEFAQTRIYIGSPAEHLKKSEEESHPSSLNLFFYHIQYDGYPVDATKNDPLYVRLHCLVTAFTREVQDDGPDGTADPGEMDLRLLGQVMRVVHNIPFIDLKDENKETFGRLEIVPSPVAPDEINKLWSTQAETPYRASLAYELALVPILPLEQQTKPPRLVSNLGIRVQPNLDYEPLPKEGFGLEARQPSVIPFVIDTKHLDWRPHIFFVDEKGYPQRSLEYVKTPPPEKIKIVIFGEEGAAVTLKWKQWTKGNGWEYILTKDTTGKAIGNRLSHWDTYPGEEIDLPATDMKQLLLQAEREWRPLHAEKGAKAKIATSDFILLTIWEES